MCVVHSVKVLRQMNDKKRHLIACIWKSKAIECKFFKAKFLWVMSRALCRQRATLTRKRTRAVGFRVRIGFLIIVLTFTTLSDFSVFYVLVRIICNLWIVAQIHCLFCNSNLFQRTELMLCRKLDIVLHEILLTFPAAGGTRLVRTRAEKVPLTLG